MRCLAPGPIAGRALLQLAGNAVVACNQDDDVALSFTAMNFPARRPGR